MRVSLAIVALMLPLAAPVRAQEAPANPCRAGCSVLFDWGSGQAAAPDADRVYGAPGDIESAFIARLTDAGFRFVQGSAPMTMTVRLSPQNRVLCDAMPGVNPDYSCHTVSRASVIFVANDSSVKAPGRVEIQPRCSDPKMYPTMRQFGVFAAETVIYTVLNQQKGSRPQVKCR